MYDRILLPTDGSNETTQSIEHAATIAGAHGATVHVLYVVDQRQYRAAAREAKDEVIASLEEEGERAVEAAETELAEHGVETTTALEEGIPYKTILSVAKDEDIDMIVIGTHGRTGRDRLVALGSVTERVVENAPMPVLVVDI